MFPDLKLIPNISIKLLVCLTLVANTLAPLGVQAHETESNEAVPFEHIYAAILDKASKLEFEELPENSGNYEPYLRGSKKYVVVGPRQYVKVDNAFKGLVSDIGRLYIAEFEQACEECILPELESLTNQALAKVAKGWFSERAKQAKEILAYRYAGAFVTLGGRYGPTAGVIKLVGELMEEVMLVVFKMPNAHIFCEVITAAIAVYAGKTNTIMRSFGNSKHSGKSWAVSTAQLIATSFVMRRAMKRMELGVQPFDINQEELEHFVEEEKEDKSWYRLRNFVGRTDQNHRVTKFLNYIQKRSDKVSQKASARGVDPESMDAMYFKDMKRKSYQGSRYGWTFLLKKRRQRDSLSQFADNSADITNSRAFWLVGLKNDILDPLTDAKALRQDFVSRERSTTRLERDSITERQALAYSKTNPDGAEDILRSIDAITDYEGRSMSQRRIELAFFQSYVGEVMPRLLNKMVESVLHQYGEDEKKLLKVYALHYRVGEVTYFAEQLLDFLRYASVASKSQDPFLKYHIRDYYLKINETMNMVASFEGARSVDELIKFMAALKEKTTELKANRFWIEKNVSSPVLPWFIGKPINAVFHPFKTIAGRVSSDVKYYKDVYNYGWNHLAADVVTTPLYYLGLHEWTNKKMSNLMSKEGYKRPTFKTGAPSCESLYL